MATCGMYDSTGAYAVDVGIPAKSGSGGGIIASARTSGAKNRGDYEAAIRSSSTAKTYMIVNIVLSAILIVLYVLAAVANEM